MRSLIIGAVSILVVAGVVSAAPRLPLRDLVLATVKSSDQVFQGKSPSGTNRIACGTGAGTADWLAPISTNCGVAVSSNTPTASGNVLCADTAVTASYKTPAACGLATGTNYWSLSGGNITSSPAGDPVVVDPTGSSTTTPAKIGALGLATGQAVRLPVGDDGEGLQLAYGDKLQLYSYHGLDIIAARGTTTPPTFVAGGGAADALNLTGGTGGIVANSPLHIGSSGTAISASYAANSASISTTVGAQSCATITTVAVTGAVLGAVCSTSATSTTGTGWQLSLTCGVISAGNVIVRACNPTAAGITLTSAVVPVRVWNP